MLKSTYGEEEEEDHDVPSEAQDFSSLPCRNVENVHENVEDQEMNSEAPSGVETLDDEETDNESTSPLTKRRKKNENAPDKSPMNFFQKNKISFENSDTRTWDS